VNYRLEKKVLWEIIWEIQDYRRRGKPFLLKKKHDGKKEKEIQGKGLIMIP